MIHISYFGFELICIGPYLLSLMGQLDLKVFFLEKKNQLYKINITYMYLNSLGFLCVPKPVQVGLPRRQRDPLKPQLCGVGAHV
jgi:hypothetical protein